MPNTQLEKIRKFSKFSPSVSRLRSPLLKIYYVFGFLYVVFFILIATCAEITMVMCYFQLCNEDYRW